MPGVMKESKGWMDGLEKWIDKQLDGSTGRVRAQLKSRVLEWVVDQIKIEIKLSVCVLPPQFACTCCFKGPPF